MTKRKDKSAIIVPAGKLARICLHGQHLEEAHVCLFNLKSAWGNGYANAK